MSEKSWKRNTAGLMAHAKNRKAHKRKGVEDAIAALLHEQKPVNFNTVAKAACVSKAYLYSQPDLRERIEALRQQQLEHVVRERMARPSWQNGCQQGLGNPRQRTPHQRIGSRESKAPTTTQSDPQQSI